MDNQKFNKVFKVGYISLLVLSFVVTAWFWFASAGKDCLACSLPKCEGIGADGETVMLAADECAMSYADILEREKATGLDIDECSQECINYSDVYLIFAFVLIVLAIVFMVAMLFYSSFTSGKKTSKTTLITLGFVVLVLILGYLLSSTAIPEIIGFDGVISEFDVVMTDTLLYAMYFLLGGAIVAILSSFVFKMIRK